MVLSIIFGVATELLAGVTAAAIAGIVGSVAAVASAGVGIASAVGAFDEDPPETVDVAEAERKDSRKRARAFAATTTGDRTKVASAGPGQVPTGTDKSLSGPGLGAGPLGSASTYKG